MIPSRLSNKELLSRLDILVRTERQTTLEILLHLGEVERRGLYLELGYGSLWDYCVEKLGYSRSAAGRRIAAARCIHRCPELRALLARNEINLMTVALIAPVLNDENKDAIIRDVRNQSQQMVEAVVARYRPPAAYRDRVNPVRVAVPAGSRNHLAINMLTSGESQTGTNETIHKVRVDGSGCRDAAGRSASRDTAGGLGCHTERCGSKPASDPVSSGPQIEKRLLIQFLASPGFMKKYDEVRSLLSNRLKRASFESVFEAALDEVIDRHSPTRRQARRETRQAANSMKSTKSTKTTKLTKSTRSTKSRRPNPPRTIGKQPESRRRRPIAAAVRDEVYKRDGGQCTYKGSNGKRCNSQNNLQIDHVVPVTRGGSNIASNLRLLCPKHNRLEAERILGRDLMGQYGRRE